MVISALFFISRFYLNVFLFSFLWFVRIHTYALKIGSSHCGSLVNELDQDHWGCSIPGLAQWVTDSALL